MTNFDPVDYPIYERALEITGRSDIVIVSKPIGLYPSKDYSLHCVGDLDLSDFWEVFKALKYVA